MSPIRGLSDQLRLPRRGKIRLGEKKDIGGGKTRVRPLDYFVVPPEIQAVYGEKPRKLNIMLPLEDRNVFFPQFLKMWGKSKGLICRGDGETAVRIDPKTGEGMDIECPGKECEFWYKRGGKRIEGHLYQCGPVGTLQVIVCKVKGLGVYQIDTGSYNSIINLNSSIEMIRTLFSQAGQGISWTPLVLEVNMQEAHPIVKEKKITVNVPVMSLTADLTPEELIEKIEKKQARPALLGNIPQAQIINPKINEKDDLIRPDQEKIEETEDKETGPPEEKEKQAEQGETSNEIEQIKAKKEEILPEEKAKADDEEIPQEVELRQGIEALFDQLNWPIGRRIIWQKRDTYDGCETIEGMIKLRDDLKKKIEDEKQGNLFKQKDKED